MLVTERSDGSSRLPGPALGVTVTLQQLAFCLYYSFFIRFQAHPFMLHSLSVIKLDLFLFRSPLSLKAILKGWKCATLRDVAVIPTKTELAYDAGQFHLLTTWPET